VYLAVLLPVLQLGVTSGASSSERLFAGFYFVDASNAAQRLAQGMMREPLVSQRATSTNHSRPATRDVKLISPPSFWMVCLIKSLPLSWNV
jgi:hypothetical protein